MSWRREIEWLSWTAIGAGLIITYYQLPEDISKNLGTPGLVAVLALGVLLIVAGVLGAVLQVIRRARTHKWHKLMHRGNLLAQSAPALAASPETAFVKLFWERYEKWLADVDEVLKKRPSEEQLAFSSGWSGARLNQPKETFTDVHAKEVTARVAVVKTIVAGMIGE